MFPLVLVCLSIPISQLPYCPVPLPPPSLDQGGGPPLQQRGRHRCGCGGSAWRAGGAGSPALLSSRSHPGCGGPGPGQGCRAGALGISLNMCLLGSLVLLGLGSSSSVSGFPPRRHLEPLLWPLLQHSIAFCPCPCSLTRLLCLHFRWLSQSLRVVSEDGGLTRLCLSLPALREADGAVLWVRSRDPGGYIFLLSYRPYVALWGDP